MQDLGSFLNQFASWIGGFLASLFATILSKMTDMTTNGVPVIFWQCMTVSTIICFFYDTY